MSLTSSQLAILRQHFSNLDPAQRKGFMSWAKATPNSAAVYGAPESLEGFLAEKNPVSVCPFCGSVHVVKNGVQRGTPEVRVQGLQEVLRPH